MESVSEALTEAARRQPDLASYYELHRKLLELQEQAKREIEVTLELADEEALLARTLQGLALISFPQLPVEAARFAGLAVDLAQVLVEYGVEVGERTLPSDDAAWLSLAHQRFEMGQVTGEQELEETATALAAMAADLALIPYLEWAAEQVAPHVAQESWKRGYCPVCGGAPDLATLEEESGARQLVCVRCNSCWLYDRVGCPFCGTTDHSQVVYYLSQDEVYRLYVCRACRRYLKTIDRRKTGRTLLPPVERLTTVAMDAAARQAGYR